MKTFLVTTGVFFLSAFCSSDGYSSSGQTFHSSSDSSGCFVGKEADGYCDDSNNKAECDYDGGDCCECTCSADSCGFSRFACIDPSASCVDDDSVTVDLVENCDIFRIGDGYCDSENNKGECGYDGGDCCECTCSDDGCGFSRFACIDPDALCVDDDSVTVDLVENCDVVLIGDGYCDSDNNKGECYYDGGDCCECTCSDDAVSCGYVGYACIDPSAPSVAFDCLDTSNLLPCPRSLVSLVVNDSITASVLARSTNCTGGLFEVEWKEHVEFPEVIYAINGTVLNITGAGAGAVADGAGSKQFLIVVNATAHVSNLHVENCASGRSGGAIYAEGSVLTFHETKWSNNTAGSDGGAVHVYDSSNVSWSGETTWSNNTAGGDGGAVHVFNSSDVSWNGETTWSNNTAGGDGGAVHVYDSSDVSWSENTMWSNNIAGSDGGAVSVFDSSYVSWSGKTTWSENTADNIGGAVYVFNSSDVSWNEKTTWSKNTASEGGGAVFVHASSDVSWSREATFSNNIASRDGGAVHVWASSVVSWSGETTWSNNTAGSDGGAVYVLGSVDVSWIGDTTWSNNTAGSDGGAAVVLSSSKVSWGGEATWSTNTAVKGGAVHVSYSAEVSWSGETTWSNNIATESGGAVYVFASQDCTFYTAAFEGNTADDAGGAVVLSSADITNVLVVPFVRTNFTNNISTRGGAVYSVSSGIASDGVGDQRFPIVYEDCLFADNRANVTGGAIDSVAGYDKFVNTVFELNMASVGGALRLGGSAILANCSFDNNISDEEEGAAISNLGVLEVTASCFSGNVFWCEPGTYLFLNVTNGNTARYRKVCDGCPVCEDCEVDDERVPVCTLKMDHTQSKGGDTTIKTVEVDPGYWRTTDSSLNILACYNEDACLGGLTRPQGNCEQGYEKSYCSVCSEGYSRTLPFTCTECVDPGGGIAIMVVVAVFFLGAAIALCMHLVSGEVDSARQGIIHRVARRLPLQSIKIIVVVWQILTQFSSVANVTYPDVYQRFLDAVDILNFDALWIPSAGCIVDTDFHDRLVVSTIGPLVALALLAGTYTVAKRRNCQSEAALHKVGQRHVSMILLISFLVYSSVSATVFQSFACEDLDNGKKFLRADYRIECDSWKHQVFQVFAGIMIFVYPVGIPLFYAHLLYKNRRVLESEVERATSLQVKPISDLWLPYKPERFYYELVECLRRISLTGVVVFIYPNTAPQVAVTLMIAFSFVVVVERLSPYVSKWDARISLAGHIIVFLSMYIALLSKVEVTDLRAESQEVFAGILVAAHICLVLAAVVEAAITTCSLR